MKTPSILIVEDELMIAELLARYLREQGLFVAGIASDVKVAKQLYHKMSPDLALLDVRLKGRENGIDFARYLRQQPAPPPFIFLTSQTDANTMDVVMDTLPAGYLTKPVRPKELRAAVSLALRRNGGYAAAPRSITVVDGQREIAVALEDVLYLESEHVYVRVHVKDGSSYLLRNSLSALVQELPRKDFCQVHRGYVINRRWVEKWNDRCVQLADRKLPVSRSRWREVEQWLSVG